jgi:hypothetical protein
LRFETPHFAYRFGSLRVVLWGLLIAANIGLLAGIAPAIVAARAEIVPALRAT